MTQNQLRKIIREVCKGKNTKLKEISSQLYTRALNVSNNRGSLERSERLTDTFFHKFIGQPLLDGTVTGFAFNKDRVFDGGKDVPDNVLWIKYKVDGTANVLKYNLRNDEIMGSNNLLFTRPEARMLYKIISRLNPNTKYLEGGRYLKIKGDY